MKLNLLNPNKMPEFPSSNLIVTRVQGVLHSVDLHRQPEETLDSLTTGWTEREVSLTNMQTGTTDRVIVGAHKLYAVTDTELDEPGAKPRPPVKKPLPAPSAEQLLD